MGLSDPRIIYGVHSIAPYSRTTNLPYGIAKVLASSNFSVTGELNQLFGGASKFAWAIEEANVTAELQINVKQVEDWMFELFLGKAPTSTATPSTSGSVSTPVAVVGTLIDATTGLASVTAKSGSEADIKFGKYLIVAVNATTVNVYAYSDVDFNRGTDKEFEDDGLKIVASALTVQDSGGTTEIPGFGLELTGGSGTVALTEGDSIVIEVMPAYSKKMEVVIGGSSDTFPEFGAIMVAQQRSNGEMFEIDAYRCKGSGLPMGLTEKEFGQPEITAQAFYDSAKNAVAKFRWVLPS
jgi:hypothetical protein